MNFRFDERMDEPTFRTLKESIKITRISDYTFYVLERLDLVGFNTDLLLVEITIKV
jgi:hypothetical protein